MIVNRFSPGVITCLTLSATLLGGDVQGQTEAPFRDQYRAALVVTYDPDVLPLSGDVIHGLLISEQLRDRVLPDVDMHITLRFEGFDNGQSNGVIAGMFSVIPIYSRDDPPDEIEMVDTRRIWQAAVQELDEALTEMAQRLERQQEERWNLQRELLEPDDLKNQLRELETTRFAVPVQIVDAGDSLKQLSSRRQEVSLQLAGIEARRQAIQDQVEELKNTDAAVEFDREIVEQLEQVVAFHEQKLKMLQRASKAAQVAQSEVMEAEAELAKARIDLLRAKKEAAATSSRELAALAEELTEATITAAEQRAILQAIESRMEELKQAAAEQARQMQAAQEAEYRAAILREQLATIEKRLAAMELERIERAVARGGTVTIIPWTAPPSED